MTTSATSLLGLALPVTGELAGTWGTTVNDSITSLLDTAVAGTTTLSTDADVTLTTTTLAANQARQAILLCSGARTALRTITAPAQSKIYTIINATTGGFSVKLVGVGPTTGLTIPNGASAVVAWNGSDFIEIGSSTVGNLTVNGNLSVTGTTTLTGAATLTANPTLSAGTANGVAYLNGSKVVTTGSALVFDGTKLGVGTTPAATIHGYVADGGYVLGLSGTTKGLRVSTDSSQTLIQGVDNTLIGSYQPLTLGGSILVFQANGTTEGMRLTSTGLGIGTSSPNGRLGIVSTGGNSRLSIGDTAVSTYSTLLMYGGSGKYNFQLGVQNNVNNAFEITPSTTAGGTTFSTPAMVIDSSGNLLVGTTSVTTGVSGTETTLTLQGNSAGKAASYVAVNNAGTGSGYFGVGTDNNSYLVAKTNHNLILGTNNTERARIDTSGRFSVGTTSPTTGGFNPTIAAKSFTDSSGGGIMVEGSGADATLNLGYDGTSMFISSSYRTSAGFKPIAFYTSGLERMRITTDGNLFVGTTSIGYSRKLGVTSSGDTAMLQTTGSATSTPCEFWNTATSGDNRFTYFYTEGTPTVRGSIDYNRAGGLTRYNTTSDQRLKENIVDAPSAMSLINGIKIRSFDWKETGFHVDHGVIAQELQQVVPEAVSVGDDNEDESVKKPWGVDTSVLVPALVKAIQEQQAIIETLTARITALEAK